MKTRFSRLRTFKVWYSRYGLYVYLALACLLLLIGFSNHPFFEKTRTVTADGTAAVASVLYKPVQGLGYLRDYVGEYISVHDKNANLVEENKKLLYWVNKSYQLAEENKRLKQQLNFVTPPSLARSLTAYIVADNGGSFARSVLVQAGQSDGVVKGAIALYNDGVLGRVVSVGSFSSRLLLLTDFASRVPVLVGSNRYLAIVEGNNTPLLTLAALPEGAMVTEGDYVVSSGHAGIYPAGLAIGTVYKMTENKVLVLPFVRREDVDFVQIVNFGLSGLLLDDPCAREDDAP